MLEEQKKGAVPLLEQFGIPLPKTMDECNLIGLDYGDGEVSASIVEWDSLKHQFNARFLYFDQGFTLRKTVNAFLLAPDGQSMMVQDASSSKNDPPGSVRYYNFKRCPNTAEAKSKFLRDDRQTFAPLTYEEAMAEGFNIVVNTLLRCNEDRIDCQKKTIILVGHPSSAGWENRKINYAKLLASRLKLPKEYQQQPVYIAVHKESNAALARETDPNLGNRQIKRGEVVVILDNGSSTFDMTMVGRNGIPADGEDSYQFGGNLLDDALLKLMLEALAKNHPGMRLTSLHGHKLGLRVAKERYYGLKGDDLLDTPYRASISPVKGKADVQTMIFSVDEQSMEKALGEIPVSIRHLEMALGGFTQMNQISCSSWLDACRRVYTGFYNKIEKYFTRKNADGKRVPDRIILSGGVSVMPEVQQVIQEVFGVAPQVTDHANYSVSDGLAYVLATEVRKGQHLRSLMESIENEILANQKKALRKSIIQAGVDEVWNIYERSLEEWSTSNEDLSIEDWCKDKFGSNFPRALKNSQNEGAQRWYAAQNTSQKITTLLENSFNSMFPGYVGAFNCQLPELSFEGLPPFGVTIITDLEFLFAKPCEYEEYMEKNMDNGSVLSAESLIRKRSKAWRQKTCQHVLSLKEKICNGGSYECGYKYMQEHFFRSPTQRQGTKTLKYDGLAEMFDSQYCKESDFQPVIEQIRKLLEPVIKDYVESITPYFNMTASNMTVKD